MYFEDDQLDFEYDKLRLRNITNCVLNLKLHLNNADMLLNDAVTWTGPTAPAGFVHTGWETCPTLLAYFAHYQGCIAY